MRLISVVMGEENTEKRSADTLAMLDYGFNFYSINNVVSKGDSLGIVKVNLGSPEYVDITVKESITVLNNSQKATKNVKYDIETEDLTAPIKVGDTVGKIFVYVDGKLDKEIELTVAYDIKKASILKILGRNLRDIFSTNI